MKPTIVTLEPRKEGDTLVVATFEEAFGEYSEFGGRGRARRHKRRMERIKRRSEERRARQEMRNEQQEFRQGRKDKRKKRKVSRKHMGDEAESENDENSSKSESGEGSSEDSSSKESSGEESGEQSSQESGEQSSQESGGQSSEDGSDSSSEQPTEEGSENFDGDEDDSDYGAEDYFLNVDGQKSKINPKVTDVSLRLERNKERLAQLNMRLQSTQNLTERQHVSREIIERRKRIRELEGMLEGYSSAKGCGKHEANRRREIGQAKRVAVKRRREEKLEHSAHKSRPKHNPTIVEGKLDASFSKDRIEVPAREKSSGANGGTGLIGIDDKNDFDAPRVRKFDVNFSSADGSITTKPKVNMKAVMIGVGVGLISIYVMNKYKVFSK